MKKKILIVLLMIVFPNVVFAASCDTKVYVQYQKLADNINYETSYSKSSNKFTITFYNVVSGLSITNGSSSYSGGEDNIVTISDVSEGAIISYKINTSVTECGSSLKSINITLPYYNTFYESERCYEYIDKLSICSSQFLTYKPSLELFQLQVKNYNGMQPDNPEPEPESRTFLDDVVDFMKDWGIQILIVVVVSVITIIPFNAKLRKIRHGI